MSSNLKMITLGFILQDGTLLEGGHRHDSIAMEFITSYPSLRDRFDKSMYNLSDFMVYEVGAIKVGSRLGNPKVITYTLSKKKSKLGFTYIDLYSQKGYRIDIV